MYIVPVTQSYWKEIEMLEQENAMWDAYAELAHLENIKSPDEATRHAIAGMIAGALYLTATAGKAKAEQVVAALRSATAAADRAS